MVFSGTQLFGVLFRTIDTLSVTVPGPPPALLSMPPPPVALLNWTNVRDNEVVPPKFKMAPPLPVVVLFWNVLWMISDTARPG